MTTETTEKTNVFENLDSELMKKKSSKLALLLIAGIVYLIVDYIGSGMILGDYINMQLEWIKLHSTEVIAISLTSAAAFLAKIGWDIKGGFVGSVIKKILPVFGLTSLTQAKEVSDTFLTEQKEEIKKKVLSRISDNKLSLFDIEKKLNTPRFLTEEQRKKLLLIADEFIKDLANDGVDYVLDFDPTIPLKEVVTE
jgi:cell division protein FtsB